MGADTGNDPPFGELLRRHRLGAGLSQEELADRAGMSARGVSDLERGATRYPHRETGRLLAEALKLSGEEREVFLSAGRRPAHGPAAGTGRGPRRTVPLADPGTPLFGREAEIAACLSILRRADARLLTLTGPGGIGKSRLALQVATDLAFEFNQVAFIDLAPLEDHHLVVPTVARSVGVQETADGPLWDGLVARLADKPSLLILDTCERVLEAARDVADLLANCPPLKIVATSRVPLRLRPERRVRVDPLAFPDPERLPPLAELATVPSVALFVDRAQAADHEFVLSSDNAPLVAAICCRLEGLPLALELAAARVDDAPLAVIRHELEAGFSVLADGPRDLPARQQSIWATLRWSYRELSAEEQRAFRCAHVFAGGCTPEAGAAAAGVFTDQTDEADRLFSSLASAHLLEARTLPDGARRYRLADVVREFARNVADEFDESAAAHARHAAFFRDFAEASEIALDGAGQRQALDRIELEHDNLRAALRWSIGNGKAETALRIGGALWTFWEMRGYFTEGREWLEATLAMGEPVPVPVRAKALLAAAGLADAQGDYDQAITFYEQAIPLWEAEGDLSGLARSLNNLGVVFDSRGEYERAGALYARALALHRAGYEPSRVAVVLNNLGVLDFARGNYEQAAAHHEESLALRRAAQDDSGTAASLVNLSAAMSGLGDEGRAEVLMKDALSTYRSLGDRFGAAAALLNLAIFAERRGEIEPARRLAEEALALQRELGDKFMTATLLALLADLFSQQGMYDEAFQRLRESLEFRREIGNAIGIGGCLNGLATIAGALGDPERAVSWRATARAIAEGIGHQTHPIEAAVDERRLDALREELGERDFMRAWTRGRIMALETAAAEALAISATLLAVRTEPEVPVETT